LVADVAPTATSALRPVAIPALRMTIGEWTPNGASDRKVASGVILIPHWREKDLSQSGLITLV